MGSKLHEILESHDMDEIAAEAGKEAQRKALEQGIPVFYEWNGTMVREDPGGEICEIEFVGKEGDYRVVKIVKEHES